MRRLEWIPLQKRLLEQDEIERSTHAKIELQRNHCCLAQSRNRIDVRANGPNQVDAEPRYNAPGGLHAKCVFIRV